MAVRKNEDVAGLDVTMDDAANGHGVEGDCDIHQDDQGLGSRHGAQFEHLRERLSGYVLHHYLGAVVAGQEVVDMHDGGAAGCRQDPRLAPEPAQCLGVRQGMVMQSLDRDKAADHHMSRQDDLTEAAGAEGPHQLVPRRQRTFAIGHFLSMKVSGSTAR